MRRTRDEAQDLVVVDLTDPSEWRWRGTRPTREFEDQFADIGLGIGTVRRRNRPYVPLWRRPATVLVGLLILVVTLAVFASSPPTPTSGRDVAPLPDLATPTRARLAAVTDGVVGTLDADAGGVTPRVLAGADGPARAVVSTGRGYVALVGRRAVSVDDDLGALAIGEADSLLASTTRGRVWLVTYGLTGTVVREVDARGAARSPARLVPTGFTPVGATAAGPIVSSVNGERRIEVVDARSRRRVLAQDALFLAGGGDTVVWRPAGCVAACPIHATTGQTDRIVWRSPAHASVVTASVAPGGDEVVLFESSVTRGPRVSRLDLTNGRAVRAPAGLTVPADAAVTWTSDGRWVLFAIDGGLAAFAGDGTIGRTGARTGPLDAIAAR